ncbi:YopN/LcrE/InvE/MxiC type III secretion system gatekeeper [Chromobacterium violaceum]|uniref:YopN/LcrE/InvE/MxiC type III secretion system gatekeeper n=1 Tax=Chromobacterium violaceum TaxID=536 RepID=UPI00143DF53C|nr:YopN/LcrE/InvE/MxiC type III secretion system gatekeeper [Chromobacterium violaceum]QIY81212.1 YopN/LcrE/InvE/MxiC type III secretion system gatekeeper [Chromobacterium violaceum]
MAVDFTPRTVFSIGLRSPKQMARAEAQKDALKQSEARQAEAQQVEDGSPAAEVQRFVQSTDEMSAVMAQFRNRRDFDKKVGTLADSFERVLDEDALPKAQRILQVAKTHGVSAEELLRQARALFPDASDLVLVLRELLRRRQLDEIVRKRLQALLAQVEAEAEPKPLKAGINCALKARLFGKALNLSPGLLRASYRQFLESDASEAEIYADWVASYGCQRRAAVLDFMEGALLADIDSQDASCSRLEFGHLLGRLTQLKLLRSADVQFVGRMLADPLARRFNPEEADWLVLLLSLLQQADGVDTLLADTVGREALLSRHADRSALLQALFRACKTLPPRLFLDESWLPALLEALREMAGIAYRHEQIERRREN